ncbi:MAG: CRISPR-associated helicase Cas3' [Pseudoflavonifractor capillosus]|uniref:CRISPR-associated helicase Cas3' n=1 Tax=Pseudoflavonifractor capillosus TaxID=106588 RepID=UPI0023F92CA1|nr:CRISPR-associated helicase Cas3' [Pseudoflavonifractor capillosus]MCI5928220.1 CRISPR-associated helicase Cas3' [Pseudoflavonifractor capillosus]
MPEIFAYTNPQNNGFYCLAAKSGQGQQDGWLPLWAHLFDTAGVMEQLLTRWCPNIAGDRAGLSNQEWTRLCVFLALVHDIGKCTPVFQSKITAHIPELNARFEDLGIEVPDNHTFLESGKTPHGLSGEAILLHLGCPPGIAAVVGAHHGRPQEIGDDVEDWLEYYEENFYGLDGEDSPAGEQWEVLWQEWLDLALHECGYSSVEELPQMDVPSQMLAAGMLIMADWIVSNPAYFPLLELGDTGRSLDYPLRIQEGWKKLNLPQQWHPDTTCMDVLEFQKRFGFMWNSVQQEVVRAIKESGQPGIFILEAQMGVGKTEAALAGAELIAGKLGCSGIFFGLPTQATANGIFPRLKQWAQRQSEQARHGIRLAHGMAELNEEYQSVFHGEAIQNEDADEKGLVVHPWFEGRKQALLSEFVIGTVDQLLMAALKQKHVMLRHLGLAGKVVIVDECHAYDAYMNRYLDRALNWLGTYGVPVILLSATLPARRRRELIFSYQNTTVPQKERLDWEESRAYPLLTWTDGREVRQRNIQVDQPPRLVQMEQANRQQIPTLIEHAVSKGGCVGIVVNTVRQAQQLAQELHDMFPHYSVLLIHSRLLMADRSEREAELLRVLGKGSTLEQRNGVIVVGTQILEQSLDIDFDFLITQLCPMDLLLQRLGRLHRHGRQRPEGLDKAVCAVLDRDTPDDGTIAVYGKWLLYRTSQLLPEQIVLPADISPLVQQTYQTGDEFLSKEDPAFPFWQAHQQNIRLKESSAQSFRLPSFDELDETMHGLLDSSLGNGDWTAQATVRDGAPGLDVLVMERRDSGEVTFLPWQYGGAAVPRDHIPSQQECRQILRQRIQLPRALCGRALDRTIAALESLRQAVVPEWNYAPLLQGELFLFLDEHGKTELCGYQLTYTRELGLQYSRKEE